MAANTTTVNAAVPAAEDADNGHIAPPVPAGITGDGVAVWGALANTPGATILAIATTTGLTRA
ncbi:hypothetical protein ACFQ07_01865, partial [Actinomadura adrarensis]